MLGLPLKTAAIPHAAQHAGHRQRRQGSPEAPSLAQRCTDIRLSRMPHDARVSARAPVMKLAEAMHPSGQGQVRQKACRERPYAGKPRTEVGVTARRDGTFHHVWVWMTSQDSRRTPLNVHESCRVVPAHGPTEYTPERGLSALQARSQSHAAGTVREPTRVHLRALVGWPRYDDEVAAISQSWCHRLKSSRWLYARPARGNASVLQAAPANSLGFPLPQLPRSQVGETVARRSPLDGVTRSPRSTSGERMHRGEKRAHSTAGAASSSTHRRRRPGPQPVPQAARLLQIGTAGLCAARRFLFPKAIQR